MYIGQHYNVAPFGSQAYNVYLKTTGNNLVGKLTYQSVSNHLGMPTFGLKHVHEVAVHKFGVPNYGTGANLANQLEHTGNNVLGKLTHTRTYRGII